MGTYLLHFVPNAGAAVQATADTWPMFRHDPQHTGSSTSTAPNTNNTIWVYPTEASVVSSPAVVNGRVIVGLTDGEIIALNLTSGAKLWDYDTFSSIWSSPAVDSGKVYVGTRDGNLYCLNEATGTLNWAYQASGDVDSSPVVSNGRIYFGSLDGRLYCINANDGTYVWNFTTGGRYAGAQGAIFSSPAVSNNVVYVGSLYDSKLYALNAGTGAKIWDYDVSNGGTSSDIIDSSPTVYNSRVYFTSSSNLYCLNAASGGYVWSGLDSYFVRSSPAVANGRVYVGDAAGTFYCYDSSTGTSLWNSTNIPGVWSSPAVADGKVYFGTQYPGWVACFDANSGEEVWSYGGLGSVDSSPAVSGDNVFVGYGIVDGGVVAFGDVPTTLPTTVTLNINPQTALQGFKVTLSGTLKGNGAAMAGQPIGLSYSLTGGQTWTDIASPRTSSDGSYSAVWTPSATAAFIVRATFAASFPYDKGEAYRMLSTNSFDGQSVISVTSNSTVSALAFNSFIRELSFTVTGNVGTVGFADVMVAKSQVPNVANLKVFLDDVNLNYTLTSTTDAWVLHVTYAHSTHYIDVDLGTNVIPEFPVWLLLPGFLLAAAFVMALKKKGLKPETKRNHLMTENRLLIP